jgi:hypothetical protein
MENELNPEILAFWNLIKYHLCDNGLLDVAEKYPQLGSDAGSIRTFKPRSANYATRIGDKMVGTKANYVGDEWKKHVKGQKVTVTETPLKVAVYGDICFETADGYILTCPSNDLRF